jgi:diguanylate cyclase (GGDEF)-like protein
MYNINPESKYHPRRQIDRVLKKARKKPLSEEEVLLITDYMDGLELQTTIDPKTGTYYTGAAIDYLMKNMSLALRGGHSIVLMAGDIIDFGLIDNRYGQLQGDKVLRAVADTLKKQARREEDVVARVTTKKERVARLGGDEFLFTFIGMEKGYAPEKAEDIISAIEGEEYELRERTGETRKESISIRIGISSLDDFSYELRILNGKYGKQGRRLLSNYLRKTRKVPRMVQNFQRKAKMKEEEISSAMSNIERMFEHYRSDVECEKELREFLTSLKDLRNFEVYLLIKSADTAMYKAKELKKNIYLFRPEDLGLDSIPRTSY